MNFRRYGRGTNLFLIQNILSCSPLLYMNRPLFLFTYTQFLIFYHTINYLINIIRYPDSDFPSYNHTMH